MNQQIEELQALRALLIELEEGLASLPAEQCEKLTHAGVWEAIEILHAALSNL